jgi:carbonic anhydrase/acetyltransferase-like protein (isoleucine patch superfamily)
LKAREVSSIREESIIYLHADRLIFLVFFLGSIVSFVIHLFIIPVIYLILTCFSLSIYSSAYSHSHYTPILQIISRHRPTMRFNGRAPFVPNDAYVAPTASVIGNVTLWDESIVWYKAVLRADAGHKIFLGHKSSVGEGSVVKTLPASVQHLPTTGFPPDTRIGHYVTIGAGCVITSCRIEDLVVVGDKCTLLPGCLLESHSMLESGSVVLPDQRIPSGQKWGGNPATFISELTPEEVESIENKGEKMALLAEEHYMEFLPFGYSYVHLEELEREEQAKAVA